MNDKVQGVFTGWLNLTSSEKEQLLEEIKNYKLKSSYEQKQLLEKAGVVTGPIGGRCPCCGR